jgi:hypothetical protein
MEISQTTCLFLDLKKHLEQTTFVYNVVSSMRQGLLLHFYSLKLAVFMLGFNLMKINGTARLR